jgi:hypothetical protein
VFRPLLVGLLLRTLGGGVRVIYEMFLPSRMMEFNRNEDGTHTVRVVAAGDNPMEFTCTLRSFLTVRIEVGEDETRILKLNGDAALVKAEATLSLKVEGVVKPDTEGHNWAMKILDLDACGNEKEGSNEARGA